MSNLLANSSIDTGKAPSATNASGELRRVGVEIEFGNLYLHQAVELVISILGGTAEEQRQNVWQIKDSEIGDVAVEIDAEILQGKLKDASAETSEDSLSEFLSDAENKAYRVAGEVSSSFVPVEIVTPPLLFDDMPRLDDLINALRSAGAEGTTASTLNGYGLHLNPEAEELDTPYLTRMLRAFLLLEDILWEDAEVNITRALMPFISKFPKPYKQLVINPDYDPSLDQLIDDYLAANPTRNRDLDMLPMFAEIDANKVAAAVDDKLVKSRPTFHYRLPDCRLDDPSWSIGEEWHRWLCIENLAVSGDLLNKLSTAFIEEDQRFAIQDRWFDYVRKAIHD